MCYNLHSFQYCFCEYVCASFSLQRNGNHPSAGTLGIVCLPLLGFVMIVERYCVTNNTGPACICRKILSNNYSGFAVQIQSEQMAEEIEISKTSNLLSMYGCWKINDVAYKICSLEFDD